MSATNLAQIEDKYPYVTFATTAEPHILPIADKALVIWLKAHNIPDGKPILVQFEFRDNEPGATYLGIPLNRTIIPKV
jgi:hypothetical protein